VKTLFPDACLSKMPLAVRGCGGFDDSSDTRQLAAGQFVKMEDRHEE